MNIYKIMFSLSLLLFSAFTILATGQASDRILYENTEKMLLSNPLEDYYASDDSKRPKFMIAPMMSSTGNWRGYVEHWEIAGSRLYLTKIDSWLCKNTKESCKPVHLIDIFPTRTIDGKVLADWFSGELRVPDGKELQYVHMGYGSTYERDLIFSVKKGAVGDPTVIDNTKSPLPSPMEATKRELQKLREEEARKQPVASAKNSKRDPKSGIVILPGQGVFSVATKRADLERVVGDGDPDSTFDDVHFVEYPKAGVEVSYENKTDIVHVIFLYNNQSRYENFVTPVVKTDKGISWNATPEDIIKAYGKAPKDFSDESKTWRRLEYPGIDFLFQGGSLGRIGILGPHGN